MKTPLYKKMRVFGLVFLFSILAISCTDNESTTPGNTTAQTLKTAVRSITSPNATMTNTNDMDHASDYLEEFDCFDLVFPLDVTDGTSTTTMTSYEELISYYESLGDDIDPNFVYPIMIQYEDGTQLQIDTIEDLENAFDECYDDFDDCFTLNFPISVLDQSGNTVTVNNEQELSDFWDAHASDTFEPTFVYPITVTLTSDGATVTISNDEEFDDLFEECYDFEDCDEEDFACFTLQYPIEASSVATGTININSDDELFDYFETLGDDEEPQFTFPLTLVFEDGQTLQVNSLEELEDEFDACDDEEYEEDDCFTFNYPLTLIKEDNTTINVNSDEEFEDFLDGLGDDEGFDFQYPFDITQDGQTQTIDNEGAFFLLFDNCL